MKVLMVGVGPDRVGGMWTVAEGYITNKKYRDAVDLTYVPTSTNGNIIKRIAFMIKGIVQCFFILLIKDIDIVHIHMAEKGSVYRKGIVIRIAKLMKRKVIIHMHAGPFMDWYNGKTKRQRESIRSILDKASLILVLGEYWKEQLKEIVDERKIEVLYNGISIDNVNSYNSQGTYITYMGVMKKEKGIYDLLDAFRNIEKNLDKKYKLVLCGNDLEGDIQQRIRDYNLQHRVEYNGWVDSNKRQSVLKNTIVTILPSYYEGLSMTIIESMSMGVPIITTDISTMPEMLGESVELIRPGDIKRLGEKICELVNDPLLRRSYSDSEFERAFKLFNLENNVGKLLDIYETVVKK